MGATRYFLCDHHDFGNLRLCDLPELEMVFHPPISAYEQDDRATFLTQQRLTEAAEDGGTGYLDALLHLRPCGLFQGLDGFQRQ